MNTGLNSNNPTLVAAFRSALLHQGIVVLFIFAVLAVAWVAVREWTRPPAARAPAGGARAEPAWRQVLRVGIGVLWIFDGLLQAQPAMAAGLPSQVIEPTAANSPGWVQHVVNWAGTSWSYHPIQAGASAVWIQIGIGAWLIAASRGPWSRLAGLASVAWGLVVWVFGEAFGGVFAPGLTWLFGAPGAVAFYCAAGAAIALPERCWRTPRLGRTALRVLGVFFAAMAVLQSWPGRGFWQGTLHGRGGTLVGMVRSMAATPQPSLLAGWVRGFASFAAAHGFAVNLLAVVALAALGAGLIAAGHAPGWLLRLTVAGVVVLCLADWVLIEDFGFFGGIGTDPNSMVPMALVVVAGYLALTRAGDPAARSPAAGSQKTESPAGESPAGGLASTVRRRLEQLRPGQLVRSFGAASTRAVLAAWALAIIVLGAAPMALAQASPNADPIIAQAIGGSSAPLDFAAPALVLTSQDGRQVSLASLRGKVVLLTFLDPVRASDSRLIAQEFRRADQVLGATSSAVELVAIVANPRYRSVADTRAFDSQERLAGLPNWLFLTGTLAELQRAWNAYVLAARIRHPGGRSGHIDAAFVIDANGITRTMLGFDPGPGTASSISSFAVELSDAARQVMTSG
jgi:cytochrome oxidase Cu insertion factor (SCO1/SenC/PrrC family)